MNLRSLALLFLLSSANIAAAATDEEFLRKPMFIDIPALPLASALQKLGWDMNVDIICGTRDCRGLEAPRLSGTQSLKQALDALLRNTRLHYEILNRRSIGIFPTPTTDDAAATKPRGAQKPQALTADESAADAPQAEPEVVITGTHIDRVGSSSPTDIYSRRTLEESGAGTLAEFLDRLPQNLNSNSQATNGIGDGQNGARGSSVNLFGLGEPGTLVLIDGHRVAPAALGNFVDVSLIPLAAVDRIEILYGGAAAIYGADAVAGVVNIILRRDFSGAETDVRHAWPDHSGATQLSAAQTVGEGWGKGHVVSSLTYRRDESLPSTDRTYSDTPGYDLVPEITDYDAYLFVEEAFSPRFSADFDGLYTNRYIADHADYLLNGSRVGPYWQRGITRQYSLAPALRWTLGSGWHGVAEFDLSQNRFSESTTYGAEAVLNDTTSSTLSQTEARVRTADARADGPVMLLPGGEAKLAVGVGKRWEGYDSISNAIPDVVTGSFARHVTAAYGELYLPTVAHDIFTGLRQLDFSIAVRVERYSDAGFTGNPKFGFMWQPIKNLSIRGNYGTSFATARFSDTLRDSNAVVIQRTATTACAPGSCLVVEEFGANSSYRPERSKSYNIGFDWTPDQPAGLRIRADGYWIKYFDQISTPLDVSTPLDRAATYAGLVFRDPSRTSIASVLARGAMYPQGILNLAGDYDPAAVDFYIDERTRNLAQTRTSGVDFDLAYGFSSGCGVWRLELLGSRVFELKDWASPASAGVSVLDTFAHPLSLRIQSRLGLEIAGLTLQLQANYAGAYSNTQLTPAAPVSSWTTWDASMFVPLDRVFTRRGVRTRLQLSVENAFNRDPPHAPSPLVPDGYDPVNANALGRVIAARLVARL